MGIVNETSARDCRFLDESYFEELYHAFLYAFSDYVMPFDLSEEQFRSHIVTNGVDLSRSVGCFRDGRLIGFTMNGFGMWNGVPTVYDAGTGVFPEYRRQGFGVVMFEKMLAEFAGQGYRQCLLEVITTNDKAVGLYRKLGFQTTRRLGLLHCPGELKFDDLAAEPIELRDVGTPDWEYYRSFWDGEPSWQNMPEAIDRSRDKKRFIGAYRGETCVGYIVFSSKVGRVAQLAVAPEYRRRGIGRQLMTAMIDEMAADYVPQVINIDCSIESANAFFEHRGFTEKLAQYEMKCVA